MVTLSAGKDLAELDALLHGVQDFGRGSGISAAMVGRLKLIVEELFVNFARHAEWPHNAVPRFEVALTREGTGVVCQVRDNALPFDPRVEGGAPIDGAADSRPIGGLGLRLIRRLASKLDYETNDGVNATRIVLAD